MLKNYPLRDKEEGPEGEENGGNGENGAGTDTAADEWKENEHPRDDDGKFSATNNTVGEKESTPSKTNANEKETITTARGKKAAIIKKAETPVFLNKIREATRTPLIKMDKAGAEAELSDRLGKKLKNDETGIEADFNTSQRNKMLSKAAIEESKKNGFSYEEHCGAAAKINQLFNRAIFRLEREDEDQDPNVLSISRFIAPVQIGEKKAYAKLTVRKIKNKKNLENKIYTVELHSLKQVEEKNAGLDEWE